MITLASIGTLAMIHAHLFCWKKDPARLDYCEEEVTECIMDEGLEQADFCEEDYLDIEDID